MSKAEIGILNIKSASILRSIRMQFIKEKDCFFDGQRLILKSSGNDEIEKKKLLNFLYDTKEYNKNHFDKIANDRTMKLLSRKIKMFNAKIFQSVSEKINVINFLNANGIFVSIKD